ncbi:50S ribosomal protein L37ae [Candidatus Woesearchaeota archaeon]|nr:50S ribosomal protein L37ae [Candidatus Woesearchaeota archaeon]
MTTKRFGARYGRRNKAKFAHVEEMQRAKHKCPFCSKPTVKRLAAGIWQCRNCDKKFSGKAYTL